MILYFCLVGMAIACVMAGRSTCRCRNWRHHWPLDDRASYTRSNARHKVRQQIQIIKGGKS